LAALVSWSGAAAVQWITEVNWKMLSKWMRAALLALAAMQLAGCAMPGFMSFKGTRVDWSEVTLSAAAGANQNSPVAVDVVMVFDDEMMARLADLPAAKWFGARADLQKTFPQSVAYRSWELVPGQTLRVPGSNFAGPRVVGVFIYANYATPGAHRIRVEDLKGAITARFDIQSFDVSTAR
jgi:type VI secretion system protein